MSGQGADAADREEIFTIQELITALLKLTGMDPEREIEVLLSDNVVAAPSRLLRPLHIHAVQGDRGTAYLEIS